MNCTFDKYFVKYGNRTLIPFDPDFDKAKSEHFVNKTGYEPQLPVHQEVRSNRQSYLM